MCAEKNLGIWISFKISKDVPKIENDKELLEMVSIIISTMPIYFTLKIQVKGNKLIVKFNNFKAGTMKLPVNKTTTGLSGFYEKCDELAESLNKYYLDF